jgi:hypothetical protein
MIQLAGLMWAMAIIFGVIGYMRGLSKELISLSGIILALFALFQYDTLLRGTLLAVLPADQKFYIQTIIFLLIVFFAYQTRALSKKETDNRDPAQSSILGGIVGFVNGYLIWGTIWYFMHINGYPLSPYIIAPPPGSPSQQTIGALPLYVLAGGPGGNGNLLAFAVIVLFLFVLIVI